MKISSIAQSVLPSAIRKMFNKALEYDNVINFTIGEPDFVTGKNVMEAGSKAIFEGKTKYSENAGIMPLRVELRRHLEQQNGNLYDPNSEIIVTIGAMGALYLAMRTLLDPGDEVIISTPCWTNYIQQVAMCGANPVLVPTDEQDEFMVDVDRLRRACTDRTKIILLNSPSNPTGSVLDHDTIAAIAQFAKEKDLIVLSDEVYKHILFDGLKYESIASFPGMRERTVIFDSFSKTYAMTGWRVGYAAGPVDIIRNMVKLQENVASCAPMPSQYAALEALTGSQEYKQQMIKEYDSRRKLACEIIGRMPLVSCLRPKGTFYIFINIKSSGMGSEEFAYKLLEEKQVVVVPGTAFGDAGEGYIRLSCASSKENIVSGLNKMKEFLEQLQ